MVNLVHGDGIGAGAPSLSIQMWTWSLSWRHFDRREGTLRRSDVQEGEPRARGRTPALFRGLRHGGHRRRSGQVGFLNQGQVCLCGSRVLVEDSIYDEFEEKFVEAVEALTIGDPSDESTQLGALISKEHLQKVRGYVDLALEEGGTVLTGGEPCLPSDLGGGNWMAPTVISGLSPTRGAPPRRSSDRWLRFTGSRPMMRLWK